MSELEFLHALRVDTLRHDGVEFARAPHELFQASTVHALLGGAFDGDVTLAELLRHGDLGLGTLNGLDGELIVIDGDAFKAEVDCTLTRPDRLVKTPYAVVVGFTSGRTERVRGPAARAALERGLWDGARLPGGPEAMRIDGHFETVRVRSVPKQARPYPTLAAAIATQHVVDLHDIAGSMVGFCFPDGLAGIEILGSHLHFVCDRRLRGGHVLDYVVTEATVALDDATRLHVELPAAVDPPTPGRGIDQAWLRRLETD
ncbi:MAG: acetolactate decarboxylase [Solirubrobacteraceae bacterium]